ncbi:MAG: MBL fold metallo-hydrolase, partial [Bacteroidales bacterium]|nr:MBL fold metallo-hydrolase [Bacteroidales bacterium]
MKSKWLILFFSFLLAMPVSAQSDYSSSEITKIILLGSGTPNPSPKNAGSSLAILVNNTPYIVDFGTGLVRHAAAVSEHWGGQFEGMNVENIKHAFLTHLHSDHTIGYADLILTPWVMGRNEPLEVYGPE